MVTVLVAFAVVALLVPALTPLLGRRVFYLAALAPAAAAVLTVTQTDRALHGGVTERFTWVPELDLALALRVDALSWVLALVVSVVGALVLVYCASYFGPDEPGLGRFAGVLTAFAGSMYGLVIADDVIVLFILWEATTVFSYLLIGHDSVKRASRAAAMQALVVTTAGGLAMLAGLVVLSVRAGTTQLSAIVEQAPSGTVVTVAVVLVLLGALTKSAIVPFHFWLPAAMAAPTPVSAYLHAAAMVKAGIYLVARLAPAFAMLDGLAGDHHGARRARHARRRVPGAPPDRPQAPARVRHRRAARVPRARRRLGHARDRPRRGRAARRARHVQVHAVPGRRHGRPRHRHPRARRAERARPEDAVAGDGRGRSPSRRWPASPRRSASSRRRPCSPAFVEALHGPGAVWAWVALVGVTSAPSSPSRTRSRFLWGTFAPRSPGSSGPDRTRCTDPACVPSVLAASPGLALGLLTPVARPRLEPAAEAASRSGEPVPHLALWHGLEPALGISALTLLGGVALFLARDPGRGRCSTAWPGPRRREARTAGCMRGSTTARPV